MVSLNERLRELETNMNVIKTQVTPKGKTKDFKIPAKARRRWRAELKKNKYLAVVLRKNRNLDFLWVEKKGGIIKYGEHDYIADEADAVYIYKNKIPVVVIPEWRLLAAGGIADVDSKGSSVFFGGRTDIQLAQELGIDSAGQQTTIRAIEAAELARTEEKKKGKTNWIWIALIGIAVLYVLSTFISGGGT